ncbi:LexA family protein [Streptomyces rubiginosohelvolus]|uniref:LexA family protein n=1 Tax=Streptomyces rubiginosohelvolus TaxID=67362 RepID=UPI0037FADE83
MRREPRPLTARQEAVLAVIRVWLAERGHGPTVREIGARVGLSSTSSVAHQLGRLEARGLIVRTGRDWSTCVLVEEPPARRPALRSRGPGSGADGYGQRPAP